MQRGAIRSSSRDRVSSTCQKETSRVCLNRRTGQSIGPIQVTRPSSKPKPVRVNSNDNVPKPVVRVSSTDDSSRPTRASSTDDVSKPNERIIHKHTVPGTSGTVEVIVKTGPKSPDAKDVPWGDVLRRKTSSESVKPASGTFARFDPLRTVHFIADELARKFDLIDDPAVKQLVSDLQAALKRVPREVSSISRDDLSLIRREIKVAMKRETETRSAVNNPAPKKDNKSVQTTINAKQELLEAEIMQRTFETSLANLESTCRNLETTCVSLRAENSNLRAALAAETSKLDDARRSLSAERRSAETLAAENGSLRSARDDLERRASKSLSKLRDVARDASAARSALATTTYDRDRLAGEVAAKDEQIARMRAEIDAIRTIVANQVDGKNARPMCSSRSGSGESAGSPPAWDAQMLSSIRDTVSPPIKDASPEVQDLFRNIIREKALWGDAPDQQIYGSLKIDRAEPKNESFKELPTYSSERADAEESTRDTVDFDDVLDEMIDLKTENDIDKLLEQVKKMAAERIAGRSTDVESRDGRKKPESF